MGLFRFLISWFTFDGLTFLEIHSFSTFSYLIQYRIFTVSLYNIKKKKPFASGVIFSCSFLILLIQVLSFFILVSWVKGLLILFIFIVSGLRFVDSLFYFVLFLFCWLLLWFLLFLAFERVLICSCFSNYLSSITKPAFVFLLNF